MMAFTALAVVVSGIKFETDQAGVSCFLQAGDHFRVLNLAGAGFMASRRVGNMDVAELVAVSADIVAKASFVSNT